MKGFFRNALCIFPGCKPARPSATPSELLRVTVAEVLEFLGKHNAELVKVETGVAVEEVLKVMKERNVLCLPVFDGKKKQFIGQVDVLEIVRFTALEFFGDNVMKDDYYTQFQYEKGTAGLLCNSPRCRGVLVLDGQDLLERASRELARNKRALVLLRRPNSSSWQYKMLTQVDIVRYLERRMDKWGKNAATKIETLGLANPLGREIVSIFTDERAVVGFQKMYEKNISAVAVLDRRTERIVANLSASDLRGITNQHIDWVKLPVMEFLEKMLGIVPEPIVCRVGNTLKDVLSIVNTNDIHRVWVVSNDLKPIGVVTLTDIIDAVLKQE